MLRALNIFTWKMLWLIGLAVLACGAKPKVQEAGPVWPSPPGQPRIVYVQSIRGPTDAGIRKSPLGRFARWLAGSNQDDEALQKPFGLALDENDNLCLTDTGANAVCYFDRTRKKWNRWDHIGKLRFASPVAVAKRKETLFVADSALRSVIAFNDRGKLLFQITNKLERPAGLVIVSDRLFVADSHRHCIVAFDLSGRYVAEFGKRGTGPGEFNFPTHITADHNGHLFVTDSMNGRVQVFDGRGQYMRSLGGLGNSTGHFSRPKGAAVDSFGHAYVVDGLFDNIQIFDATGRFVLNVGEAGTKAGEFWLPNGIVISRANEIFVADSYNHRLQIFKYVGGP
jgi:sugar lactone lactonase YvrE